jgi:hypothetical protein
MKEVVIERRGAMACLTRQCTPLSLATEFLSGSGQTGMTAPKSRISHHIRNALLFVALHQSDQLKDENI